MRWPDGFESWKRLRRWHERSPRDGDAALDALSDIGIMRRLLDQAELAAVRAGRSHAKTWAEIATRLGVTRQSAWERWRDLDDEQAGPRPPAEETLEDITAAAASDVASTQRSALTVIPDVIGLDWTTARRALSSARLVAVNADPDGPPLPVLETSGYVVIDQKPAAGARRKAGSPVTLWLGRGPGSAGVREPLRPRPSPRSTGGAIDEVSGESVP